MELNTIYYRNDLSFLGGSAKQQWCADMEELKNHLCTIAPDWSSYMVLKENGIQIDFAQQTYLLTLESSYENNGTNVFGAIDIFYNCFEANSSVVSWGIILTNYGAALIPPLFTTAKDNAIQRLSPINFTIFFCMMEHIDNDTKKIPAIFYKGGGYRYTEQKLDSVNATMNVLAVDINTSEYNNANCFIMTPEHFLPEEIPYAFIERQTTPYLTNNSSTNVWFTNMLSKQIPYFTQHLYTKIFNNSDIYGIQLIEDTWFFVGSHYMLEIGGEVENYGL